MHGTAQLSIDISSVYTYNIFVLQCTGHVILSVVPFLLSCSTNIARTDGVNETSNIKEPGLSAWRGPLYIVSSRLHTPFTSGHRHAAITGLVRTCSACCLSHPFLLCS